MVVEDSAVGLGLRSAPRVSVVMSVYNGARYLRRAVDSILAQTFGDFEFLIVNDGSTDDTREILASYHDPRIEVFENERNRGLAASLNRGLSVARGEYIARQDADDISHPERLSHQVGYLDSHADVGVVGTTTEWIDDNGETLRVWRQPTENGAIQETLLKYCCLIHGSTMSRRRCLEEAQGYDPDMRTGQDYDLWLRVSETWDVANLSDGLYEYRWHDDMASARRETEQDLNADIGLSRAFRRRKEYARSILTLRGVPERLNGLGRRRLAQRYVWWSAGARSHKRITAAMFLLAAMVLDPTTPEMWSYIGGIGERKIGQLAPWSD